LATWVSVQALLVPALLVPVLLVPVQAQQVQAQESSAPEPESSAQEPSGPESSVRVLEPSAQAQAQSVREQRGLVLALETSASGPGLAHPVPVLQASASGKLEEQRAQASVPRRACAAEHRPIERARAYVARRNANT